MLRWNFLVSKIISTEQPRFFLNLDQESMNWGVQRSKVKRSDHEKIKDQSSKKAEDQRSRKDQLRSKDQRSAQIKRSKINWGQMNKDQRSTKIKDSHARMQEVCGNNVDNFGNMIIVHRTWKCGDFFWQRNYVASDVEMKIFLTT